MLQQCFLGNTTRSFLYIFCIERRQLIFPSRLPALCIRASSVAIPVLQPRRCQHLFPPFIQMFRRTGQSFASNGKPLRPFTTIASRVGTKNVTLSAGRRTFSHSAARNNYEATIQNLRIHKDTKVICQGFTGKTVRLHFSRILISYKLKWLGYFPCEGGPRIRNPYGRWCLSQQSWSDPLGTTSFRFGQGGACKFGSYNDGLTVFSRPCARLSLTRLSSTYRHHSLRTLSSRLSRMRLA